MSEEQNTQQQAANQQAEEKQAGEQETGTAPEKAEEKLFRQEDVNNIVSREAKKAQEKLLKQLGIDDFDSAKEGLEKFREWQESQKSEAEKQAERLQKLESDYNSVSEENASLKAQIAAMKSGVKAESVEDVVVLAKTLVDDDTDMNEAIKKVIEKYPHFAEEKQEQKPSFTTGQHTKEGNMDAFAKTLLGK
ncbi:hypothetical protein [Novibacillus thermophilus]|uniref:hypothetical protein n=1 Tax=Novibacillus thermophilus TaxID=1471761 RepID=UPI0015CFEE4C|nr:hypothetical protein [Novibacillus thermophilus]